MDFAHDARTDQLRNDLRDLSGGLGRMMADIRKDFADVRAVLSEGGSTVMGVGRASGENRAVEAAREAMGGPLIEGRMDGATSILLNVTGSTNMSMAELTAAADEVRASAHPDANIIFGATVDKALKTEVQVTLIATGFEGAKRGRNAGRVGRRVGEDGWVAPWLRDRSAPVFPRPAAIPTATSEGLSATSPLASAGPASTRRKRVTKATRKRKEQAATTPVVAGGAPEAPSIVDLDVPSYLRRS